MFVARIAVIGPSRAPVAEPFSGGLDAHVWSLCTKLLERGHDVTLFAAPGSDPALHVRELALDELRLSPHSRSDVSMPPDVMMREHHAYLSLMMELAASSSFDVLYNNSLHYLPLAMARFVTTPMITTLHTPPTPWLESAVQSDPAPTSRFVAVSEYTARQWRPLLGETEVVPNGVDLQRWPAGPGGRGAVWSGRLVPEKAPHLAVQAARVAGMPLTLVGPIGDPGYFEREVAPLLGGDVRYAGHLNQAAVSRLVRSSCVSVVTPLWDEPYGLVVAESLASGTPVAALARGGIPEVVDRSCSRLVVGADVEMLAAAIRDAARLSRADARARAVRRCSVDTMIDGYEALLGTTVAA